MSLADDKILFLPAALCCWFAMPRSVRKAWLLLGLQIGLSLIVDATALLMSKQGIANIWLFDLYLPVEFALLMLFSRTFFVRKWIRTAILVIIVLFACGCAVECSLLPDIATGSVNYSFTVAALCLTVVYMLQLFELLNDKDQAPFRLPSFWISLGLVTFFGSSMLLDGLFNVVNQRHDLMNRLYVLYDVVFCVRYGLMGVACLLARKHPSFV